MRLFKLTISVAIFLMLIQPVSALSVGNDEIYLIAPLDNAIITGQTEVKWFMKDADQSEMFFQVDLFRNQCAANGGFFGIIANGKKPATAAGSQFTASWNTLGPIVDKSEVPDGAYCVRTCAIFRQSGNNLYSFCDKRSLTIANNNQPPQITSFLEKSNYKLGEKFSYQVIANDSDQDKLSFSLSKTHDFLQIDSETGLITSKSTLTQTGSFQVEVTVVDGKNGADTQLFVINIGDSSQKELTISFIRPSKDNGISKDNNEITWTIEGEENVKELVVAYSTDGENWTEIEKFMANPGKLVWDLGSIASGEYLLRITVTDSNGKNYEKISEKFTLSNDSGNGEEVPLITEVFPQEDSQITDLKVVIKAMLKATEGGSINQEGIKVILDTKELSSCSLNAEILSCETEELVTGRHEVTIEVTDSNNKLGVKKWFFEIIEPGSDGVTAPGQINLLGRTFEADAFGLALLILCLGLVLLLLPWFIYLAWVRRRNEEEVVVNNYDYVPSPDPFQLQDMAPQITVNAPAETTYVEPQTYEPSVGTQEITNNYVEPQPVYPVAEAAPPALEMPTTYSNDDIPDWLKEGESGSGSEPVAPSGSDFTVKENENESSDPYQDYGLASQRDDNNGS